MPQLCVNYVYFGLCFLECVREQRTGVIYGDVLPAVWFLRNKCNYQCFNIQRWNCVLIWILIQWSNCFNSCVNTSTHFSPPNLHHITMWLFFHPWSVSLSLRVWRLLNEILHEYTHSCQDTTAEPFYCFSHFSFSLHHWALCTLLSYSTRILPVTLISSKQWNTLTSLSCLACPHRAAQREQLLPFNYMHLNRHWPHNAQGKKNTTLIYLFG